ncbi:hypothetical protein [Silvibacterium dinghuense]|uniref:Flagellar hook-length control protein FliK n=1 Tax=Silvibacterium dinghuense TaxID=1560006 RepID=A0A4Q1SEG2_9BACT|nr:hypothetical protein [Silvibacterium dinghuense]RXS95666.1 hypothetical protein ESZ00_14020 [Silvibacterium dinghuense]GGH14795.1 hypothetical protein GCM10011586_35460 [Silvibacterium dinghuense]
MDTSALRVASVTHAGDLAGAAVSSSGISDGRAGVNMGEAYAAHTAAGTSSLAGASNPYQRLDQPVSAPAVLHASQSRVSIGVQDPSLGWLEVNTRSGVEGQVAAAILTSSSHTQATMSAELPSLAHYLAENAVKVSHLDVAQQAVGDGSSQAGGGGSHAQGHAAWSGQSVSAVSSGQATGESEGVVETAAIEDSGSATLRYISVLA